MEWEHSLTALANHSSSVIQLRQAAVSSPMWPQLRIVGYRRRGETSGVDMDRCIHAETRPMHITDGLHCPTKYLNTTTINVTIAVCVKVLGVTYNGKSRDKCQTLDMGQVQQT